MDKLWKQTERRIAKLFNTRRTPLSGSNSLHTESDTLHESLFIEIKQRKKIPFLRIFMETIEKAKKENKTPMVIMHETNSRTDIVMIALDDFLKSFRQKEKIAGGYLTK